jgi:hypothetical protein
LVLVYCNRHQPWIYSFPILITIDFDQLLIEGPDVSYMNSLFNINIEKNEQNVNAL